MMRSKGPTNARQAKPAAAWQAGPLERRFDALCELGDFHARRLLEIGCGRGDLLEHLHRWQIVPDYHGIDSSRAAIARCRRRFEDWLGPACRFMVGDARDYAPSRSFDFVVASSCSALRGAGVADGEVVLERLFSWCTVGLVVVLPGRDGQRPARLLEFALGLTQSVRLEHDYLPGESALCLYRLPAWEQEASGVEGHG